MEYNRTKLLVNIAHMYYEKKMTQDEISKKLGIYRTTISRYLKEAEQKGIVKVSINYELYDSFLLEKKLKEKFNLTEVLVSSADSNNKSENERLTILGVLANNYLKSIIKDNDLVGLSWGRALAAFVDCMNSNLKRSIFCVPMVGGPAGKLDSRYHVNTLVYQFAKKMNGRSLLMDFPAMLDELSLKNAIVKSNHYKQINSYWDDLSIAIFGIGSSKITDSTIWTEYYGFNTLSEIEKNKIIVGDICSRFFNEKGMEIETQFSNKIINISLEQLKKTKNKIAIAHSSEKVEAILGAINGGYVDVLVTTNETAQQLVL